jgi:hypothetical protein
MTSFSRCICIDTSFTTSVLEHTRSLDVKPSNTYIERHAKEDQVRQWKVYCAIHHITRQLDSISADQQLSQPCILDHRVDEFMLPFSDRSN